MYLIYKKFKSELKIIPFIDIYIVYLCVDIPELKILTFPRRRLFFKLLLKRLCCLSLINIRSF